MVSSTGDWVRWCACVCLNTSVNEQIYVHVTYTHIHTNQYLHAHVYTKISTRADEKSANELVNETATGLVTAWSLRVDTQRNIHRETYLYHSHTCMYVCM